MESDRRLDRSHAVSARFAVRLMPRGGADRVDGVSAEGVLQARVSAPAVGGAANAALVRLLADELDGRAHVRAPGRGATGRHKLVIVDGVSPEEVAAPLARPQGVGAGGGLATGRAPCAAPAAGRRAAIIGLRGARRAGLVGD